jgi:hypothetical protein
MLRRIITGALFLVISFAGCFGQNWLLNRYEIHFGLGTTNVFGDIGGTADKSNLFGLKDIRLNETGSSFYLGARYKIKDNQALKLNLIYGTAKSSDEGSRNATRMFSYKTSIFEPSLQYEYYFLSENRNLRTSRLYNRRGMINNFSTLSFYAFGGLGGVFFNPQFSTSGLEPQPNVEYTTGYSKFSVVLPIGIGLKTAINKLWSVGFEFGRRFAFSDYIDGLSTSFSKAKDTYYFGSIHMVYKIETDRYGRPLFLRKQRYRR